MVQENDNEKRHFALHDENRHLLEPPPVQRAAYSDRTAWLMGQLSELAYVTFEDAPDAKAHLEAELAKAGFRLIEAFNEEIVRIKHLPESERKGLKDEAVTDTQAILVVSDDKAVLAFRGSEPNKTDWLLTDADAVFVNVGDDEDEDGKPERVHRGFYESYLSVRDQIERAVRDHLKDELPLFVTGHSLGGALATVAGRELEKVRSLAAIYTYGSPRVGNPEWAQTMKVPLYRVVNSHDAVALVPLSGLLGNVLTRMGLGRAVNIIRKKMYGFIGYQHVGDFRFLTDTGELKLGSDATIARLLYVIFDTVWMIYRKSIKKAFGHAMSFGTDHFMTGYNKKLEQIALRRNPAPN